MESRNACRVSSVGRAGTALQREFPLGDICRRGSRKKNEEKNMLRLPPKYLS